MALVLSGSNGISTTGANPALTFDASGRVFKPNQISFFARSAYSGNTGPSGVVPFTDVRLNNGSAFNGTTGRFTAPIAGTYFFFGSLLSRSAGNMNCQIRINGGVYVYSEDTRTSNFGNCYPKCIAYLNVNDFADINASYATYGSIYDYFGGYLLG